jgi:hypothetical protein
MTHDVRTHGIAETEDPMETTMTRNAHTKAARIGTRTWIAVGAIAALGVALLAADRTAARAGSAGTCTAFVGGVSSAKGAVPELVIFNTQFSSITLDLKLLDADGMVLVDRPAEITVTSQQTVNIDLIEQLKRGLPKTTKPYAGTFTVQLNGPVGFTTDVYLVHVTQYFGSKAKPKAAYVLRPVFRDNGT